MPPSKRGRPSKVDDPATIEQAGKLCRLFGATDAQLAEWFGVTETTVNNWKNAKPEFFETIKDGKREADDNVERSLYQRATGYSHPSEKLFLSKDGEVIRAEITEHYPPDTTAGIFWLCNRRRDEWRQRQELDVKGKLQLTPTLVNGDD